MLITSSDSNKFTDLDKILNSNFDQLTPLKKKSKFKHEKSFNFDHYSITNLNGALIDFVFPKTVSLCQLKEVNNLKNSELS